MVNNNLLEILYEIALCDSKDQRLKMLDYNIKYFDNSHKNYKTEIIKTLAKSNELDFIPYLIENDNIENIIINAIKNDNLNLFKFVFEKYLIRIETPSGRKLLNDKLSLAKFENLVLLAIDYSNNILKYISNDLTAIFNQLYSDNIINIIRKLFLINNIELIEFLIDKNIVTQYYLDFQDIIDIIKTDSIKIFKTFDFNSKYTSDYKNRIKYAKIALKYKKMNIFNNLFHNSFLLRSCALYKRVIIGAIDNNNLNILELVSPVGHKKYCKSSCFEKIARVAAENNFNGIALNMLKLGVSVNLLASIAVRCNNYSLVKSCIKNGADNLNMLLSIAKERGLNDIVEYLEKLCK